MQKAGDKVRINVQLVDAYTDSHLWAKSYDRDFKDIFAVESDRRANCGDVTSEPFARRILFWPQPTHDAEAYDLFLKGEYEFRQAQSSIAADALDRAEAFYRQALARDPNFAMAAAELARNRLFRHWLVSPLTPQN